MEEIKNIPDMTDAEPIDIAKKMISILDEKDAKGIKLLHVEDQTVLCRLWQGQAPLYRPVS